MSGFVKLDCGILRSTLWLDRDARDVFITALLLAEPREFCEPMEQIEVNSLKLTGWVVPPGWYGFVPAAGVGIIDSAKVELQAGLRALERMGSPEPDSRSSDYEGRRMVRIDGGYLILNYQKYRDRDYTAAERQRRYRERQSNGVTSRSERYVTRNVTQAEAEVEAEKNKYQEARARARSNDHAVEEFDPPFKSQKFLAALADWLEHRRETKQRVLPGSRTWSMQRKKIQEMGEARAIAAIEHSIANGYSGLFEPRIVGGKPNPTEVKRPRPVRFDEQGNPIAG